MFDIKEKKALLNRILKSDAFVHSQVYQNLLTYLIEASINNTTPKEYTIATEVFHKSPDFDPSKDTIVRVYIYNLRKKLEHYYSHEGINEEVRIDLPKGHYEITFRLNTKPTKKILQKKNWIILLIVALFISNGIYLYKYYFQNKYTSSIGKYKNSPIWSHFLSSKSPKQMVIGDHFFFIRDSGIREKRTIMRRDDINSVNEFNVFKRERFERSDYKILTYPMFPRNSVWPFADIIGLMVQNRQNYKLNYASNVTATDIKNNDMLFIGSFHTLAAFNQIFRKSKFSFRVYPNELSYYNEEKDTLFIYPEEGDPLSYHVDYGVVMKIPGPNNNIIFIFTGFHETGTVGIIKYFTDPKSLKKLEQLFIEVLGKIPQYFELLYMASGYDRTVYTTEILHVHEINQDASYW